MGYERFLQRCRKPVVNSIRFFLYSKISKISESRSFLRLYEHANSKEFLWACTLTATERRSYILNCSPGYSDRTSCHSGFKPDHQIMSPDHCRVSGIAKNLVYSTDSPLAVSVLAAVDTITTLITASSIISKTAPIRLTTAHFRWQLRRYTIR